MADPLGRELQQTFICAPQKVANNTRASFIAYRKTFHLDAQSHSAKLHIFADARYMVWINGESVHRGPNRFETRGPEYDSVQVANGLHTGTNTLAVVVMGNAGDLQPVNDGIGQGHNARMMKHAPGLTVQLDVDGSIVLKSDESWKWSDQTRYRPAKVDWADIIDCIDMRVEDGDWTQSTYDDRAWQTAEKISGDSWGPLSARRIPLLRDRTVQAKLAHGGVFPVTLAAGQHIQFLMGHLVQAYTVITLEADEGTHLRLDYAGIEYTAKAGRQTYTSSDTCAFAGGAITVKSGRATILNLKLVERLYPFDRSGSFQSSDPLLNRLWEVCARTSEILSEDAYVDCADRERAEWMDCDPPSFEVTRTAFVGPGSDGKPCLADARLLGEMLRRTALTQQKEGWVKAHTCSDRFDIHALMEDRGCDWVQGARRYYESTGDATLVREIWPVIVGQMDYFLARRTARGLVLGREWVVWGNPVGYVTCEGAGLNAFVYKALIDAAYLGKATDNLKTARRFERAAEALARAFNTALWNEDLGTYYSGFYSQAERAQANDRAKGMKLRIENNRIEPTMFSAIWSLDQEIVPIDRRPRVLEYLLKNRAQADRVMTFYYLDKQMYQADTDSFDREILANFRNRWKAQAESLWGTTWEEFNGGSKAHCYGMFPGYFLSANVLGVRPELAAAQKRIVIEPHLGDLSFAEGAVVTEFGIVPIAWKSSGETLNFNFTVPPNIKTVLRLPAGDLVLDGKPASGIPDGRRLAIEVRAGNHQGVLTFKRPPK